ncbi:RNA-directed DNA polymerase, eukaryota, reverse transcriptase zinc-binding domain protein [Tanacetum coccineum]
MDDVGIKTLAMEQYLALTYGNQAPGVVKPKIGGNVNFEIKITHDVVMLRVFPITLTEAAKRYCRPSKSAKQLEEIHNFKQEADETLYQAWEMYNDLLYKCLTHDLNNHQKGPIPNKKHAQALTAIQTLDDHSQKWHDGSTSGRVRNDSSDEMATITNKLDGLGRDMKKLKENVKSVKEVKYGEFQRAFPNNNENGARYRLVKDYQAKAANEVLDSSVGQCKAIFANNEVPTDEVSSKGTTELQGVSFISNELNPRRFTLPCTIGSLNFYAMADLGVSVNIMPRSMFNYLKKADMSVEMADMTKKAPVGIIENVSVKIDKFLFPFDYMIIDMLGDPNKTMILGRPFFATIHARIGVFDKEISWVLNEWILDSFDMEDDFARTHNDPYSRSLHEYKAVFDNEIEQLANKYELRIGKKGYVLDNIWEKCEQVHGGTLYSWHDDGFDYSFKEGKVQGNDPEADGHRRKCPRRNVDPP